MPQARPRVNVQAVRRGRGFYAYLPKKTRDYQNLVASNCPKSTTPNSPKSVYAFIHLMAPTKVSVFSLRPDLDNFVKSALDGLVAGGAMSDDAFVRKLHVDTIYVTKRSEEKLVLMITPWDGKMTTRGK